MNMFTRLWLKLRKKMGAPRLLCDSCKFDYPGACSNPDRPNATVCPDYQRRF
jgi:hypothetical protein